MRKTNRSLLLLGLLTTVLAAAVWAERVRERSLQPAPLVALDPATVQRVEVQCTGCRTRRFLRAGAGWRMLEPYALPANPEAVARLIAVAQARPRMRLNLADYDLRKLGLDPPKITLTLDTAVIAIGGEDAIEHDRYVRTGDELLRVPDSFSARLLETPESELADPSAIGKK